MKGVAAIQHCFKIERLNSRDCSLLVMERGKSTDQANWEGGEDGGVAGPPLPVGSITSTTSFSNRTTALSTFTELRL